MKVKELIKVLQMKDQDAVVTFTPFGQDHSVPIQSVSEDEGLETPWHDFELLSKYKDTNDIEQYQHLGESDNLAFVSLVVLQ